MLRSSEAGREKYAVWWEPAEQTQGGDEFDWSLDRVRSWKPHSLKNLRFSPIRVRKPLKGLKLERKNANRVCILKEVWSPCGEWITRSEWDPTGGHDDFWVENDKVVDA